MNSTTTPIDTPIACSLTAAEYRARVADTGQLARDAIHSREAIPGGARLVFADVDDVRQRLEGFVAAESICCPFLTLDLRAADQQLVLDVTGPAAAAPIIEELFA